MQAWPRLLSRFLSAGALALALACGLAACGRGRDAFAEAESLEKAGKLEEAAARFDVVCAFTPEGPGCAQAGGRAFEARMKAAEAEIGQGRFLAAERLVLVAEITAGDAERKRAQDRLAQEDLLLGVRYERALAMADKKQAAVLFESIAPSKTPAAAKAREWLDKEGPALAAQAVKAACGPEHEGSCSEAFAKLQASGAKGPGVDEATRAAEAEQRRVQPLRAQAESFLKVFATRGREERAFEKCRADKPAEGDQAKCHDDIFGTDPDDKLYQSRKNNETLFRRLLKRIADPALTLDLEARRARALAQGSP